MVVSAAIMWLLLSLRAETAQDYAFAAFFLICTTSLLKIRRAAAPTLWGSQLAVPARRDLPLPPVMWGSQLHEFWGRRRCTSSVL